MYLLKTTWLFLLLLASYSCKQKEVSTGPNENEMDDFDYKTTRELVLKLDFILPDGTIVYPTNAKITINDPAKEEVNQQQLSRQFFTEGNTVTMPTHITRVFVAPNYPGFAKWYVIPIVEDKLIAKIRASKRDQAVEEKEPKFTASLARGGRTQALQLSYLSAYDATGKPNNIIDPRDILSAGFLNDINVSLPEGQRVPQAKPEFIASGNASEFRILEEADVWLTFVHEGAGWKNSLGFYTYDENNPPKSSADIHNHTIIFPNVSLAGSGGNLISGDKVYLGRFQAGVKIGWFLVANGWWGGGVGSGSHVVYSNPAFNPEPKEEDKQHFVILKDPARERIVLGIEDMRRDDPGCDQDFNDALFFVSANPIEAIEQKKFVEVQRDQDSDGDGVSDEFDEFPNNPEIAITQYFPSNPNDFVNLLYEDLYPAKGDFDLNDLVVGCRYFWNANAAGRTNEINAEFWIRAIGASYNNSFALHLPIPSSEIISVAGAKRNGNVFSVGANGVEPDASEAVIPIFEDAFEVLHHAGGLYANTENNAPISSTDTLRISIKLASSYKISELGGLPFNPFICINQQRTSEVHLPQQVPTSKFNTSLFGVEADNSDPSLNRYFVDKNGQPFALMIPQTFRYPIEKTNLNLAYPRFAQWANSNGAQFADWYLNKNGNIITFNTYNK